MFRALQLHKLEEKKNPRWKEKKIFSPSPLASFLRTNSAFPLWKAESRALYRLLSRSVNIPSFVIPSDSVIRL